MTEGELTEFLEWFKENTEKSWENWETELTIGIEEDEGRWATYDWQTNTKWSPMTENEILQCESRWGIVFPWDYRLFLSKLGIPSKPALIEGWISDKHIETKEAAHFMNWRASDLEIATKLSWPVVGLFSEGERPWWWDDSWGKWVSQYGGGETLERWEEARNILSVTRAAPQLIPFYSHRYIYPSHERESPVLSVMQTDIIIYGVDLRIALLGDFASLLKVEYNDFEIATYESLRVSEFPFWGKFLS